MPSSPTPSREAMNALIQHLASRELDLITEQGRHDYKVLVLTRNAADLLDMPTAAQPYAVATYACIAERLRNLVHHGLMEPAYAEGLMAELKVLYEKFRPELVPLLPVRLTPEERAGVPRA